MPFLAVALFASFGLAGVFSMVAVMYALLVVASRFAPETRARTLEQINATNRTAPCHDRASRQPDSREKRADMDTLNISATANGLNYLPEYLADATGLFRDAGLAVTARACDPWTGVLDDLESGAADLALGGLWVPGMYAGTPPRAQRDLPAQPPGAEGRSCTAAHPESFEFADLRGKVVLAPGIGGSAPYAVTAGLIREAGVDPAGITFLRDLSTPMFVELFHAGLGDAIILDLVTALEVEATGAGTIVFRNLDSGGIMPNSVYYARTDRVEELRDRFTRFTACIDAAMTALPTTPAATIDSILAARWPAKDLDLLRDATRQMTASTVWETVAIDPAGSDRWMRMIAEAAMVTRAPSYSELTDDTLHEGLPVIVFLHDDELAGVVDLGELVDTVRTLHIDLALGHADTARPEHHRHRAVHRPAADGGHLTPARPHRRQDPHRRPGATARGRTGAAVHRDPARRHRPAPGSPSWPAGPAPGCARRPPARWPPTRWPAPTAGSSG